MCPSGQYRNEAIIMRLPLHLIIVHDGRISSTSRMDVYTPNLTRLEYNWIRREIEFLVPRHAGPMGLFVYLCPELFLH